MYQKSIKTSVTIGQILKETILLFQKSKIDSTKFNIILNISFKNEKTLIINYYIYCEINTRVSFPRVFHRLPLP